MSAINWLDTETKAILKKSDEPKLAPPKTPEFALVLLQNGTDLQRLVRAVRRINDCSEAQATNLARSTAPVTIHRDLTEEDALLGQFELVCCDAIAAFIRTEVLMAQDQTDYLKTVFAKIVMSPEFTLTKIEVVDVPATPAGETFLDQFLGMPLFDENAKFPRLIISVPFKKAAIMKHWASRIGAEVRCHTPPS